MYIADIFPVPLQEGIDQLRLTPILLRQVRSLCKKIAWDIAEDLPKGPAFAHAVQAVISRINQAEPIASVMTVVRAELRPATDIPDLASVGAHWAWDEGGARVYHHDNAPEHFSAEDGELQEIIIVATVPFNSIDWPFTLATNLILPGEHEITVRPGSRVALVEIFAGNDVFDCHNRKVPVYGEYRSSLVS
jgi:hypothetical protein